MAAPEVVLLSFIVMCFADCQGPVGVDWSLEEDILEVFLRENPVLVRPSLDGRYYLAKERQADGYELLLHDLQDGAFTSLRTDSYTQLSLTWHPDGDRIFFQQFDPTCKCFRLRYFYINDTVVITPALPASNNAIAPLRFSKDGKLMGYLSCGDFGLNRLLVVRLYDESIVKIIDSVETYSHFDFLDRNLIQFTKKEEVSKILILNVWSDEVVTFSIPETVVLKEMVKFKDYYIAIARPNDEEYFGLYKMRHQALEKISSDRAFNIVDLGLLDSDTYYYIVNRDGLHTFESRDARLKKLIDEGIESVGNVYKVSDNSIFFEGRNSKSKPEVFRYYLGGDSLIRVNQSMELEPPTYVVNSCWVSDGTAQVVLYEDELVDRSSSPIVIYIHGGPYLQYMPNWSPGVEALLRNDISFAAINYHGSSGFSRDFAAKDEIRLQVDDIVNLVEFLVYEGYSLESIVMMASSYGGLIAVKAGLQVSDIYGLYLVSGIYDRNIEMLLKEDMVIRGFYGEHDELTKHAIRGMRRLSNSGSSITWTEFKDEGHLFHNPVSWAVIYSQLVDDLRKG